VREAELRRVRPDRLLLSGYEKNGPGVPTDKVIFELKRRAFDLGLGISGTGVGNNFTIADKAARGLDVQRIKNWTEVAAKLGAPVLRVFADTQMRAETWESVSKGATATRSRPGSPTTSAPARSTRRNSADHRVQNTATFSRPPTSSSPSSSASIPGCGRDRRHRLLQRAPDPYAEMGQAAPYAVQLAVKQSLTAWKAGRGPTDLKKLLRIVRDSGYRGYLPFEALFPAGRRQRLRSLHDRAEVPRRPARRHRRHA